MCSAAACALLPVMLLRSDLCFCIVCSLLPVRGFALPATLEPCAQLKTEHSPPSIRLLAPLQGRHLRDVFFRGGFHYCSTQEPFPALRHLSRVLCPPQPLPSGLRLLHIEAS